MPGIVKEYVDAVREVDSYAAQHSQDWDVRQAYEENLQIERESRPEVAYWQSVRNAIEATKHEIREAYGIEMEREHEDDLERERIRETPIRVMHP